MPVRDLDRRHDIVNRARNDHPERFNLVVGSVRTIKDPRDRIEPNFALDSPPQLVFQHRCGVRTVSLHSLGAGKTPGSYRSGSVGNGGGHLTTILSFRLNAAANDATETERR